jgi:type II secretory pathway pseudopilin PulG
MKGLQKNQKGFTLLHAVVAIAIASIMIPVMAVTFKNSMRTQRHLEMNSQLEAIRRMLIENTSCHDTLKDVNCDGAINVVSRSNADGPGRILIEDSGSQFGSWTLRAICDKKTFNVIVEVAGIRMSQDEKSKNKGMGKSKGKGKGKKNYAQSEEFTLDPLNGKELGWKFLFPEGLALCGPISGTNANIFSAQVGSGFEPNPTKLEDNEMACAYCPKGKSAKSGGATCLRDDSTISGNSELTGSFPNLANNGWCGVCRDADGVKAWVICEK